MQPTTVATLKQLENEAWFSRIGVKDTQAAMVLSSWEDSIAHCGSLEWENLCLEAANQLRGRILERSRERYAKWNEIAEEVRETAGPFVRRKIEAVVREHNLPKVFADTVRWDIIHLCMEAEYADLSPPGFYSGLAYWYVAGHFPCGWSGEYPKGMLVVY